jgi:hypothetical protein
LKSKQANPKKNKHAPYLGFFLSAIFLKRNSIFPYPPAPDTVFGPLTPPIVLKVYHDEFKRWNARKTPN